ncbi:hypothetical protein BDF19DRAFT_410218 [Syncephalis fuscata]|nr:hypothetical protein BDF19DRAFT_410218 [Syncephalis fuscata]
MNEESASDGYFLRLLAGDDSSLPLGLDLGPVNQNGYEDVSMHDSYAQPPGVVGGDTEWTASELAPHNYADIATTATVNDYMTDFGQYDQTDYEELLAADMDELDYGGEESGSGTDEESTATATAGKATVKTKRHNLNENEDTEMPEEQEFAKYMQDAQKAAMEMQQEGGPLGKQFRQKCNRILKQIWPNFIIIYVRPVVLDGTTSTSRTRQTTTAIPLQVKNLLQQANSLYVGDRETDAIPYLNEAIRLAPQVEHAWLLLALIKENQGEEERAFVLRFCAAQNARDPDLWCWVAEQLRKRNNPMHAVHCYTRALSLQPKDIGLLHARCEVYMEAGRIQRAIEGYETILKLQPEDEVAIHHLLRFYVERGRSHDAILLYERLMEETLPIEGPVDPPLFRWEQTNFLAELYMEIGDYERALLVIKRSVRRLQLRGTQIVWETRIDDVEYDEHPLPIDLRVKLGVCRLAIGEIAQAKMHFARLNGLPIVAHQELYHQMAEAYMEGELIHEAIEVYSIIAHEVKTDLQCRIHLSRCYRLLDNSDAAAEVLVEVANAMPKNRQVREELAKLYESLGEQELAVLYLSQAPETESDNQEDEDESENDIYL